MTYQLHSTTKHNITSLSEPYKVAHNHLTPQLDEYFHDTLRHLLAKESDTPVRSDYMQLQPELTLESRQTLLDWLIKAHFAYQLCPHSLFLAIGLTDRFLSLEQVQREEVQLLGLACLLIASKIEDILPLSSLDLSESVGGYCTPKHIAIAERNVLRVLGYNTVIPSSLCFYEMIADTLSLDPICHSLARYLLELLLCDQTGAIGMRPSLQAATCLSLAVETTRAEGDTWSPPEWLGVSPGELLLSRQHLEGVYLSAMSTKNHAVRLKFSTSAYDGVAVSLCQAV